MNGKYYTPGQTWDDGCDKKCICEDGVSGPQYTCVDRYLTLRVTLASRGKPRDAKL